MLRGFRWQLLALIVATAVFVVSFFTRPSNNTIIITPTPLPTVPQANTDTPLPSVPTATTQPVEVDPITAQPITNDASQFVADDGVITYREAVVGDVQRLNPLFADLNPVDMDITSLIFEGLTQINEFGEVQPLLARNWVISSDGLEYVFTLREDVLWQDGLPFTAADVVYTVSLLSSPDFPGSSTLRNFWRTVEVEQISETLVRFRLTQPLASFPEALRIGILPFHALEGTNAVQIAAHPFNLDPIGTGPYQLEDLRFADGEIKAVDLRVAPTYRQRPEGQSGYDIERMRFALYETVDSAMQAIAQGNANGYASRDNTERLPLISDLVDVVVPHTAHEPAIGMLIFNWTRDDLPEFREQRVRQALALGLDRESIIQRHLLNIAVKADNPLPLLSWAYEGSVSWSAYNVAAAQELLNTANISGNRAPSDGEATPEVTEEVHSDNSTLFNFTILTLDQPALVSVAQEIATQWALLNIDVQVEAVNLETYTTRLQTSEFDAVLVELSKEGSADPDMYSFWHQGQYPDGQNYGGVNDRLISETLERARRDSDGTNRVLLYRDFQEAFIDRVIAIPLYYPLFTYAVTPQVSGVQLGLISRPSDRFATIQNWRFD